VIVVLQSIRYLPTKSNRETWRLEKEVRALILQAVEEGKEAASGNALLNMILEAASNSGFSQDETDRFIVDNCKNILSLAILIKRHSAILKLRREKRQGAAPSVRKKRDFVAESYTHFNRFDLTLVVLLCLENFREYILFCI
jgi:hypothetical protein